MNNMVGLVLTIVVVIFLVSLAVGFIELSTPIILKADFNRICDTYIKMSVPRGGLTVEQTNEFSEELENLSPDLTLNIVNISRPGTVPYKTEVTFIVEATFSRSTMINVLIRQLRSYIFRYNKSYVNDILVVD